MSRSRAAPALALLAALAPGAVTAAAAAGDRARGEMLWLRGASAAGRLEATLGPGGLELAGPRVACAGCHGQDGEGGGEGGLAAPPIDARRLRLAGLDRPGALSRLLREGARPDGRPLHPAMPRYDLAPEAAADLAAFAATLGLRDPPGVDARSVRLGLLLGPGEAGARVGRVLRLAAEESAARGGLWGRTVELVPLEGGDDSPERLAGALDRAPVLAVVAPLGLGRDGPTERLLAERRVACVFPLRPEGPGAGCSPALGPGPAALARHLARGLRETLPRGARLVLLPGAREVTAAAEAELAGADLRVDGPDRAPGGAPPDAVLDLREAPPAPAPGSRALPPGIPVWGLLDRLAPLAAAGAAEPRPPRYRLADPRPLGDPSAPATRRLRRWLDLPPDAEPPALERTAYAAFLLVEEALRRAGRKLRRASLPRELAGLAGLATGLLPPVDFARHPREGFADVRLLALDPGRPPAIVAPSREGG